MIKIIFYGSTILLLITFPIGFGLAVCGFFKSMQLILQIKSRLPELYSKYKDNYFMFPYNFSEIRSYFAEETNTGDLISLTEEIQSAQKKFLFVFLLCIVLFGFAMISGFFLDWTI